MLATAYTFWRKLISIQLLRTTTVVFVLVSTLTGCGLIKSAGQSLGLLSAPAAPGEAAPPASEQPYQITLNLQGTSNMNPNTNRRASPAQVRLFVTDPAAKVAEKSFEEVFDYSGNIMKPRPLREVTVRPGENLSIDLPAMKSDTRLVVAVAFREPYQSIWMAQADIVPLDSVIATATVDADRVTILPTP